MNNRNNAEKIFIKRMQERDENSIDVEVYSRTPDRREFADSNGDTPNKKLSGKYKKSDSSKSRMPQEEGGYDSSKPMVGNL